MDCYNNKNFFEAYLNIEKLLLIDPNDSKSWYYKGTSLCILKEFDDALQCFDNAIKNNYIDKVLNKAVQEAVGSIAYHNANKGMVVTNSKFTNSAIELAESNNIELIDKSKLENLLSSYPVAKKEL